MKLKIYVGYHKVAPILKSRHVVPIHLGSYDKDVFPEMIGDHTGAHISDQNDIYCELTALYWAWKNDTGSDHIGLMHYRRVIDFDDDADPSKAKTKPSLFETDVWLQSVADFAKKMIAPEIIIPPLHYMSRTVEENYKSSHDPADFDLARDVVARHYPEYSQSFEEVACKRCLRLGNIAIMQRAQFDAYCTWLFDILFQVQRLRQGPNAHSGGHYRPRFAGHLAERLLTVYIHHLETTRPDIWIEERPVLKLSNALILPYSRTLSLHDGNPVNLALSCDNAYVPHAAAMLRSVIDHMDPDRPLNVIWLHDDVPEYRQNLLREMVLRRPKTAFFDVNTAHYFADGLRSASRAPSNATYNRFLLFRLFPALKRVVYLDCDVIVRADIGRLFDSDLGDKTIGAVPDWIMTRSLTAKVQTADPLVPDLLHYQQEQLGLSPADIETYINAGVLVIDIASLKDPQVIGEMLSTRARMDLCLFRDQDILNAAFAGNIALIDPRWNVFNSPAECYTRIPIKNYNQAMVARRDPWIIHYADSAHKPWQMRAVPEAQYYWQALIETPFYGDIIARIPAKNRWRLRVPVKRWLRKLSRTLRRKLAWGRPVGGPVEGPAGGPVRHPVIQPQLGQVDPAHAKPHPKDVAPAKAL